MNVTTSCFDIVVLMTNGNMKLRTSGLKLPLHFKGEESWQRFSQ
jgi:hypothetical protein